MADLPSSASTPFGLLGSLAVPLGLGVLRLATEGRPEEAAAIGVVHAALDLGIRVLDTADVYALDDSERHYGERLVRRALDSWSGPRHEVRVLTKVGLTRPQGRWLPNGRPDHLRRAVDESLAALGVERLFLLQLHARDSRSSFEEALVALAELQRVGKVEHLGLCNVSADEVRQAERHFPVAAVQNELSLLNRKSAEQGLLELSRSRGIPLLAHRPLGGYAKTARLAKNRILAPLAERHGCTPHEVALAALRAAGPHVLPLVGATRAESVRSCVRALSVPLDVSDRTVLDIRFSFAAEIVAGASNPSHVAISLREMSPFRTTTAEAHLAERDGYVTGRLPQSTAGDEVVVVMGIQGAGKSQLVEPFVAAGYARLNRDQLGGRLDDLVPRLTSLLVAGQRRVVLDNTYPTRTSRAPLLAAARAQGVPVRCLHLDTPPREAHVNLVLRHLERYGRLLGPDDLKRLAKSDPNLPPPVALSRWSSTFEPPGADEGFAAIERVPFVRRHDATHTERGLLLDVDGTVRQTVSGEKYPRSADDVSLLPGRRETLALWTAAGYRLFFVSNQSGIASGKLSPTAAEAAFRRTIELLGLPVEEVAYCPHPAFPVGCFCRKPMPGLGVYLQRKYRLAGDRLIVVGDMASDAEFAAGLGARYYDATTFFTSLAVRPDTDA